MVDIAKNLSGLAERINAEHRACETAVNSALTHAMNAGGMLSEAKASLPHGAFGPWLKENFAGSDRTARAYMRVHSHREELEAKRQSSATLSLDGALKALSMPKDAPEAGRSVTLEEMERQVEAALSKARAGALGIAENLDAIRRGRGYEHHGYASFADYVTGEFATRTTSFPIPYEVISDDAGEPLPVFAMAESIHAWGMARAVAPLLREDEAQ
jgi:Protein of unknown function (DUF3102)